MIRRTALILSLFALLATALAAQPVLAPGDVLLSATIDDGGVTTAVILVYSREGLFKGELIRLPDRQMFDLFFRNGLIYWGSTNPGTIERVSGSGTLLSTFNDDFVQAIRLSPGPDDGVVAVAPNDVYQLADDGSRIRYFFNPLFGRGIDLSVDGCTVFFVSGGSLGRWDACVNSAPALFGPVHPGTFDDLRVLSDGTFLVTSATGGSVLHLDAGGNVLRDYNMSGTGLALDIDGTSFWTNVFNCLRRVDISSGAVLVNTCPVGGGYLAVVGEPRAGLASHGGAHVPMTGEMLLLLAVAVAVVAVMRLR